MQVDLLQLPKKLCGARTFQPKRDIEELQSTPGLVSSKINALTRASNLHDWTKFSDVFEKTANLWAHGHYNPDIRELNPSGKDSEQHVRDAYGSIFSIEYLETKRKPINKDFMSVYLTERVLVKQEWISYFKNILALASNGKLRFEQKQTTLSTAGGDMVIKYRKEGYFKLTNSVDKSEKHLCIAPALPSLFIFEDLNSLHMQAKVNSRNNTPIKNNSKRKEEDSDNEDNEDDEEEEDGKKGWKCIVM